MGGEDFSRFYLADPTIQSLIFWVGGTRLTSGKLQTAMQPSCHRSTVHSGRRTHPPSFHGDGSDDHPGAGYPEASGLAARFTPLPTSRFFRQADFAQHVVDARG